MSSLILILNDQLSHSISSLSKCDRRCDTVLIPELLEDLTNVKHHKKKIILLLAALRHFAAELRRQGYKVEHIPLDSGDNTQSLEGELTRAIERHRPARLILTSPSEYRVRLASAAWSSKFCLPVDILEDDRFLCSPDEFAAWAAGRSQLRMEYFYRDMRKKHSLLLEENGDPIGGRWNFDSENRQTFKSKLKPPPTYSASPDAITEEVISLVAAYFPDHFGDLDNFNFAVTRDQALAALSQFIEQRLSLFGDYQDVMVADEAWLYHSHLSFYLNCGLLLPLECVEAAENAYRRGAAPLNSVEGFIRQIIGWREYVRGIYWLRMPDYTQENFFNASRALPEFYWTGSTDMNCMRQCITQTKEQAYAHHIQRLMVLGNFALLAGLDPAAVNEWYLIVYADAYEWVELPNVSGMILFADGGYLASKPYAASGAYINKMSDYCNKCRYKVTVKNGDTACPFNYLYWDFLERNRHKLDKNPRISVMYKAYDRMPPNRKQAISADSEKFLDNLNSN